MDGVRDEGRDCALRSMPSKDTANLLYYLNDPRAKLKLKREVQKAPFE